MKAPLDENTRSSVSTLEDFFHKHPSIEFIRYQWVDLPGILRTRILPKEQTLKLALQNNGVLRCSPVTLQSLVDLSYMPDWGQSGGLHRLCPDWSSLRTVWPTISGMRDSTFRHVEKSGRNLIAAGVKIHDFHAEGASGQYEISLAPLPPMEAADEIVRAHDIIKTTVAAEGYIATMNRTLQIP